ncbi:ROK family protein [Candidatus Daviesbacteria bacterium]|nr:ROK family protein [Candidatus Daviesbacteria bacterium]
MYILFDIGGTKTRVGISKDHHQVTDYTSFETPHLYNLHPLISNIEKLAWDNEIEAIAGGIAGPLNQERDKLANSPQLPDWIDKPIQADLKEHFKVPVFLENDAALAGLGEANFGAGKGYKIVAYLTISTGVGGVKIVDQKIDQNVYGFEPGQMIISDGTLISLVSGMALEKTYHQKGEDIKDPQVWDKVARYLAEGLNNTILDWSPQVIILGGSIIKSVNLAKVENYLKQNLTIFKDLPEIKLALLGDQSGLYGAMAYLNQ